MKGAVISGATGMVGVALARLLLQRGFFVVLLIRQSSIIQGSIDIGNGNLRIIDSSMEDYHGIDVKVPGVEFDFFFHLAWAGTFGDKRNDARLQEENVSYMFDAMDLAKRTGCRRFVGLGSQAEYGPRNSLIREEDSVSPSTGYGLAKYQAGRLGKIYARQIGIGFCWGRLFSAYGPFGNRDSVLNYVASCLKEGKSPKLGACEQIWDFIHVDDVANALLLIAEKGRTGETYNIASGDQRKLKEFIEVLRRRINPSIQVSYDLANRSDVNLIVSTRKLKEDTGFVCQCSFEDYQP